MHHLDILILLTMGLVDDKKSSRRSTFTHFFSPTHHHEQLVRRRAQSLHAQSTRENSILHHNYTITSHSNLVEAQTITKTSTSDKRSTLKPYISAPLPASSSLVRPSKFDTDSSFSQNQLRTSFIEAHHYGEPPSSSERKVQFVEPESPHRHTRTERESHHYPSSGGVFSFSSPAVAFDSTNRPGSSTRRRSASHPPTKRRTVARISISTGKLYYIQEPALEYPFASTCFSPPPYHATHPYYQSHTFGKFSFRKTFHHRKRTSLAGVCPHLRESAASGLHPTSSTSGGDHDGGGMQRERQSSDTSSPSSMHSESREHHHHHGDEEGIPLYTSASEKFHAHWGTFAFNMRFSMFRAQDRVKDGVAWMGGVVRRMRTERQH